MGLAVATLLNAWEMYRLLGRIAAGAVAMPLLGWLPAPNGFLVYAYLVASGAAGLALLVGWRAAGAAAVTTVLNAVVFLWDEQTYSSHRLLATLLVAYLAFTRSDAVWAVRPIGGPLRRGPQVLMMTQLSVVYLFASLSKLNVSFLSGAPLSVWLWIPLPQWAFTAMAFGTVATEVFLAAALWIRRYRAGAMVLGALLHLSIVTLMREDTGPLIAFSITCLCLYPLFWVGLGTPTHHNSAAQTGRHATVTVDAQPACRHTESA
jgi:hypothetical protein